MFSRSPLYQLSNRDSKKGLITATTFFYTAVNIPALPETGLLSPRILSHRIRFSSYVIRVRVKVNCEYYWHISSYNQISHLCQLNSLSNIEPGQRGTINTWNRQHVKQATRGTSNTWNKQHVEQATCGTSNTWNKQYVEQVTRGTSNTWNKQHVEQVTRGTSNTWNK